ncbi:MAG: DUF5688 family protein [Eubacteriales bacterium]|nr:DUF5688 family protein [Lachnospiraceae bacterium]MDO5127511.1 DUF5688 family protein [Eubacteriales bacterium]
MLEFQEFVASVREQIADYLLQYDIDTVEVKELLKNNDVVVTGLIVHISDCPVTPNLYLESYYEKYRQGSCMEEILGQLRDDYIYAKNHTPIDSYEPFCADTVRERIFFKLVNRGKNESFLQNCPYISYMDLAITFRYMVICDGERIGSALVRNQDMEQWNLSLDTLYAYAKDNTRRIFSVKLTSMAEIVEKGTDICLDMELLEQGPKLYVLTNERGVNGASLILYDDILAEFADRFACDFYILPSSIHEVLLLPKTEEINVAFLSQTVREVNSFAVGETDYLSDCVYYYNRHTKSLSICD